MQPWGSLQVPTGRVILALILPLFLSTPEALAGDRFRALAVEYGQAKKKLASSSKKKNWPDHVREKLFPLLKKIAALGGEESLKFLEREYTGSEPILAAACARALLSTDDSGAVDVVTRGYNRNGKWPLSARIQVLDALAASAMPAAVDFLVQEAGRSDLETQTIAMGSLGRLPGNPKALEGLIAGLRHRAYEVRNAALRSLERFRFKAMIPALIDMLGREKDEKLRVDALQFLVRLTGHNMGFELQDWKKWWEVAEATFEFARGEKGKTRVVARDLTYFGIEVTSKRVSFLVDASNSMLRAPGQKGRRKGKRGRNPPGQAGGRKIDILKKELTRIIGKLPEDTDINIIFFNKVFAAWKKELHSLRGRGRGEATRFVNGITCAWGTNIYDTLEFALKDRRVDTLYLLSDGKPVGGTYSKPPDILREIGAINRIRGATIHCISFGAPSGFLETLAKQNKGIYRHERGL